ncbi:MAG: glycosyltransferase [Phycisphaerales bacterium]
MIFVTVGAQMPFDRLVRTVDAWAGERPEHQVLAQIGTTGYKPMHLHWTDRLDTAAFRRCLFEADLVVTHAGMGTILSALELGKPTIVMPRRGHLRETRNDHQLSTAQTLAAEDRVAIAWDERELRDRLESMVEVAPPPPVPSHASSELLAALSQFIRDGSVAPIPTADLAQDDSSLHPIARLPGRDQPIPPRVLPPATIRGLRFRSAA